MPRVHWKQLAGFNGVAAGIFGFLLVGLVCLGVIGFGVYQRLTSTGDTGGSGEVLTVLGMYFSVPYLFVLAVFILAVFDFKILKPGTMFWTSKTTLISVIILYLFQQGFTNVYLVLLHGPASLAILIGDLIVLGMFIGWKLCPNTCVAYVMLYAIKLGLVWGDAWRFAEEPVFGASGFATLLFICIPIIQLTLFSPTLENEGISQAFVSRFNIAMTHLLHSLDIISCFTFCFQPLEGTEDLKPIPIPLRWMILVFVIVAFCATNLGVPLLFFRGSFRAIRLPQRIRASSFLRSTQESISHRDFNALESLQHGESAAVGGGGSRNRSYSSSARNQNSAINQEYQEYHHHQDTGSSIFPSGVGRDRSTSTVHFMLDQQQQQSEMLLNRESSSGGKRSSNNNNDGNSANYSEHEQMLTFLLLMLMLVDFPFLTTRMALWSRGIERMDVFAAKNIKSMLDVIMLLTRARGHEL